MRIFFTIVLMLVSDSLAVAAPDQPLWIGREVMPTKEFKLQLSERATDRDGNSLPYVIKKVDGQRFWVGDREPGWVNREEVVLIADAPAYYTRLIEKNPRDAWAYSMRAIAWNALGELDKAIKDHTANIRLHPNNDSAYFNRGIVWANKGEHKKAIADYGQAIETSQRETCSPTSDNCLRVNWLGSRQPH
jgi:tetratricopeptide (TPR) repeat protein